MFDIPVLLIAYRRVNNLKEILNKFNALNVTKIYISLDGPIPGNLDSLIDHNAMLDAITKFREAYTGDLNTLIRHNNFGCSASILSACNWIFENETKAVILEDDCRPSDDFFKFAEYAAEKLEQENSIWLACGSQFMDDSEIENSWVLSNYPLSWGWITLRDKWCEMLQSILTPTKLIDERFAAAERAYWNAGSVRAQRGFVDVWDTVLVQQMLQKNKLALLPRYNLVANNGLDSFATNTHRPSPWFNKSFGTFSIPSKDPHLDRNLDQWLRTVYFGISLRHLVSTKVTRILDKVGFHKKLFPLSSRFEVAEENRLSIQQNIIE